MVMVVADMYAHKVKDQATRGEADKAVKDLRTRISYTQTIYLYILT